MKCQIEYVFEKSSFAVNARQKDFFYFSFRRNGSKAPSNCSGDKKDKDKRTDNTQLIGRVNKSKKKQEEKRRCGRVEIDKEYE